MKVNTMINIPKKVNEFTPESSRPIVLTPQCQRLLQSMTKTQIFNRINSKIHESQYGFMEDRSTIDAI